MLKRSVDTSEITSLQPAFETKERKDILISAGFFIAKRSIYFNEKRLILLKKKLRLMSDLKMPKKNKHTILSTGVF